MKRFLLAGILTVMTATAMVGCNNGVYDADPKTNNTGLLPPTNGDGAYIGTMKGNFAGHDLQFFPASYQLDTPSGIRYASGINSQDTLLRHQVEFVFSAFGGVKQYPIALDTVYTGFAYSYFDTNDRVRVVYSADAPKGHMVIDLKGIEGATLRGSFSGVLYRIAPVADNGDSVRITNGQFYLRGI